MPEVPQEFLRTVLFLGYNAGGFHLAGTAFYVNSPTAWDPDAFPPERVPRDYADDPARLGWLVTARHVIEGIERRSEDGQVLVSVNAKGSGRMEPRPQMPASQWIKVPDDAATGYAADCAILPFVLPSEYDLIPIPMEAFATFSRVKHAGIGTGHDVVFPSLYDAREGTHRNVPLMRIGTIAAMADPEEPVYIKAMSKDAFAYIVEARSYPGVSGSPVLVALPAARSMQDSGKEGTYIRLKTQAEFYLLGLMITHFGLQDPRDLRELVNLGLGVVLDNSYIIGGIRMAIEDSNGRRRGVAGEGQ